MKIFNETYHHHPYLGPYYYLPYLKLDQLLSIIINKKNTCLIINIDLYC